MGSKTDSSLSMVFGADYQPFKEACDRAKESTKPCVAATCIADDGSIVTAARVEKVAKSLASIADARGVKKAMRFSIRAHA